MTRALLFIFLITSVLAYGQQGINRADLSSIPQLDLPLLDNDKLVSKELKQRETIGRAPEFATPCKVDAGCHQSGQWTMDGDRAIWKMLIKSEGAKSLNFGFTDFYLPTSASFYMTGVTSGQRRGPFISADNDSHDQFWSPIIEDDEVLLELEVDIDQKEFVRLHLAKVNHGFFKFGSKNFSGSCNLDVVCTAADGWGINDDNRDIIRSVVMYSLNGTRQCTGMLINNIRENGTPYIMTADHCEVSTTNASTVVAYYNFENTSCRQPDSPASGQGGNGSLATFNTGATWISATDQGTGTDFNLLQLDDPINPAANAFISGWNRESAPPSSAIGIHHPRTEEKRISYDNDPLQISNINGSIVDPSESYLQVIDWDTGTTESGSSGSPLFNPEKQFIGQLFGGFAACGNNESDFYGRLSLSWEGGGSSTTRVKEYLDPDNIKLMEMEGMEASVAAFHSVPDQYFKEVCSPSNISYILTTNPNFVGTVAYSVIDNPSGATVDIQPVNANPGEAVTINVTNTASVPIGQYALRIKTEDGNGNLGETPLWFEIQGSVSGSTAIIAPVSGSMNQIPNPTLKWQDIGVTYEVQLATTNTFATLTSTASDLEEAAWKLDVDLDPNTTYYWRVRGVTLCEDGPWSVIASFTTGNIPGCSQFSSADVPKTIDIPMAGVTTSALVISDPGRISDVTVSVIRGTHTYLSDLSFSLISPTGTEVLLLANLCESQDNFNIGFDDDSSLTNPPCPYTDGMRYKPAGLLSVFQGEFASGTWLLKIVDSADDDGGELEEWSLEICTVQDPSVSVTASQEVLQSCSAIDGTVVLTAGSGFSGNVTLSIESTIAGVTTSLDQTTIAPGASTNLNVVGTLAQNETVTVRATDGIIEVNKNISLELLASPAAPELQAPTDMAMDVAPNVNLSWQAAANASEYRYQVSTNSSFTNIIATNTISETSAEVNLTEGETYYWRVQSINDCDTISSEVRVFSVSGRFNITISEASISTCLSSVEYLVTLNSGVVGNVNATLNNLPSGASVSYENNPGTTGQTIKVIVSSIPLTASSYNMTLTLVDDTGNTDVALQLIVEEAPGLPTLTTPSNNTADIDTVPSFEFVLGSSANSHELEVATDVAFTDIVIQSSNLTEGSVAPGVQLSPNTTYYWRVKASNSCGLSISPIYQFLTKIRTSIDDVFEAESIALVPNPTSNVADIVIETTAAIQGTYQIFGINGQVLKSGFINAQRTRLDTSDLAEGVYLVRIQDENTFIVKKLIIF